MLVLTRKVGEKILIGDDIIITVVDIGQSRLKVGHRGAGRASDPAERADCGCRAGEPFERGRLLALRTEIVPGRRSRQRRQAEVAEPIGA